MPENTSNHNYNRPDKGTQDWGQLLNANFEALDADIELRDAGPPSSNNYDPVDGGKYLDTDAGVVYLADGSSWTETFSFGGGGGGGGGISSLTGGDGINPDSIGNGDTLSVALGEYMGIDNGAVTFGASAEWKAGGGNTAIGNNSTVSGGLGNTASGSASTVSGGRNNTASGSASTVGGGFDNTASGVIGSPTVGGGSNNTANEYATVAGGRNNEADFEATVGGGVFNRALGVGATASGGSSNLVEGIYATIAGGGPSEDEDNPQETNNVVYDNYGTIGGGGNNQAGTSSGDQSDTTYATVGGGRNNTASGELSTVAGGADNTASNLAATVAGGLNNTANGGATVGGGGDNTASAGGATVPGGSRGAAESTNSFVWNDGTEYHDIPNLNGGNGLSSDTAVSNASGEPTGPNTFSVSADDGVRFITGGVTNPKVTYIPSDSAGWTATSTRTVKTNIDPVEPREALAGVESMEVATWEYENEDGDGAGTTHIGPMAEEFHDAFDVGSSDEHINSINADGVALAAIQGLSTELDETREELAEARDELAEKDKRIAELEADSEQKDERIADLEARLAAVEDQLGDGDSQ